MLIKITKEWVNPQKSASPRIKCGLHPKMPLSVWWDVRRVVFNEILENKQAINAEKYSSQLKLLIGF